MNIMKTNHRILEAAACLLMTATAAWGQISTLDELDNRSSYLIKRLPEQTTYAGTLYGSTERTVWVAPAPENNDNRYWAVYTSPQTGARFIYNLGQQQFMTLDSNGGTLKEEASVMTLLPTALEHSWLMLNENRLAGLAEAENGILLSGEDRVYQEGMAFSLTPTDRQLTDEELQRIAEKVQELEGKQRDELLLRIEAFLQEARELEQNALPHFAGIYRYAELEAAYEQADAYSDQELEDLLIEAQQSLFPQEGKFYHLLNKSRPNANTFTDNVLSVIDDPDVYGPMNLAGTPDGNQRPGTIKGMNLESLSLFQFTPSGMPGIFYLSNPALGVYAGGNEGNGNYLPLVYSRTLAVPYELIPEGGQLFRFRNSKFTDYYFTLNGEANGVSYNVKEDSELWYLEEVEFLDIEIGETGWATLCLPCNIELPEEIEAYVAVAQEGNELKLKPLKDYVQDRPVVPAFTAVILHTAPEHAGQIYTCLINEEKLAPVDNLLKGITQHTMLESGSYILANGSQGVGFYRVADDDRRLAGNRVYLPQATVGTVSHIALQLDGPTTDIQKPENGADATEQIWYDLDGKRKQHPQKGVFISKDGVKKVFRP